MSTYLTKDPLTAGWRTDSFYIVEEVISSKLKYVGRNATQNADAADPSWQVKRVITSGNITITAYANQGFFDQKWSERTALFPAAVLDNQFSVHFDGVNDRVILGDNYSFERTLAFSVSFWFWAQNTAQTRYLISKVSNDVNTYGWRIGIDTSGRIQVQARTTTNALAPYVCNTSLTAQEWHHVCLVYDGSSNINGFTFYIDGAIDSSFGSQVLAGAWTNNGQLEFGASKNANHFVGHIDEVSIWDKQLSSLEVAEIHHLGSPTNLYQHTSFADLLSWWRMGDGDVDPTLQDNVASVNGTLENGAYIEAFAP